MPLAPTVRGRTGAWADAAFSLDARSLAVFRMAIGGILVCDSLLRCRDFGIMFAPDGLFPLPVLRAWQNDASVWSACFLDAAPWWQACVLAAEGAAGAWLALGWHTRLATFVAWAATVSVLRRTAPAANAGDVMLVTLLFWSLFVPLGAAWSIDAARRRAGSGRGTVWAAPIVLQIAAIYLGAGIAKSNASWLSGDAVAAALSMHDHGTAGGEWLASLPWLPTVMTWGVVAVELTGPVLLVAAPSATVRLGLVAAFWALHLGIAIFMTVGLFAPIGLAAWTAILPTAFWDALSGKPGTAAEPRTANAAAGTAPPAIIVPPAVRLVAWAFVAVAAVIWLHESGPLRDRLPPRPFVVIGNLACIPQRWTMFGDVPQQRQWVLGRAELADGRVVDLLRRGRPIEQSFPEGGFASLPHHRWHKLFWELPKPYTRMLAPAVTSALVRDWNARHGAGEQVVSLEILFARAPLDGGPVARHEIVVGSWPERGPGGDGNLDRLLESLDATKR